MPQCTAKAKATGRQCRRAAVSGWNVCTVHGRNVRGLAHPSTTHGRFSKHLPTRLLADYEDAIRDPDYLALRDEIAVLAAREAELLGRVDTGEAGRIWGALRAAWNSFERGEPKEQATARALVGRLIDEGLADSQAWSELIEVMDARRRLVDTERRRLEAHESTLTADRAMLLVGALVDSVRRHVSDRAVLDAISRDLEGLVGQRHAAPGSGDPGR